jgi:hypothetical protein
MPRRERSQNKKAAFSRRREEMARGQNLNTARIEKPYIDPPVAELPAGTAYESELCNSNACLACSLWCLSRGQTMTHRAPGRDQIVLVDASIWLEYDNCLKRDAIRRFLRFYEHYLVCTLNSNMEQLQNC